MWSFFDYLGDTEATLLCYRARKKKRKGNCYCPVASTDMSTPTKVVWLRKQKKRRRA